MQTHIIQARIANTNKYWLSWSSFEHRLDFQYNIKKNEIKRKKNRTYINKEHTSVTVYLESQLKLVLFTNKVNFKYKISNIIILSNIVIQLACFPLCYLLSKAAVTKD